MRLRLYNIESLLKMVPEIPKIRNAIETVVGNLSWLLLQHFEMQICRCHNFEINLWHKVASSGQYKKSPVYVILYTINMVEQLYIVLQGIYPSCFNCKHNKFRNI
jgi:hypothetical protein